MDFQKLLEQFQTPENLKFLNLVNSWQTSPDETFYEIETNHGFYCYAFYFSFLVRK